MRFFQNLNVYLRKTCTIVLFKVFPIWSYDYFPSFWQFVDSIPKELRRLGGQEWIKPIFDTLFWCELYSSEGVLHRPEQMVVRKGKVWEAHNTVHPSDPIKYRALPSRHGYSGLPLIWLVGRVLHMLFAFGVVVMHPFFITSNNPIREHRATFPST